MKLPPITLPVPDNSGLAWAVAMGAMSQEEAAEVMAAQRPSGPAADAFERGFGEAAAGRHAQAMEAYTEAMTPSPGDSHQPLALYNRACSLMALQAFDKARADLEEATRLDSSRIDFHVNLAHLFLLLRLAAPARESAERALKIAPGCLPARLNLGHSLLLAGRTGQARRVYRDIGFTGLEQVPDFRNGLAPVLPRNMADDISEFRTAGWPQRKLDLLALRRDDVRPRQRLSAKLASRLRGWRKAVHETVAARQDILVARWRESVEDWRYCYRKLVRKRWTGMPPPRPHPPEPPAKSLLGSGLAEVREESDFFRFFHFEPAEPEHGSGGAAVTLFKPSGPAFRAWVTLAVSVGVKDARIEGLDLSIARRFIDDAQNGIFAADLAQSFLLNALPPVDRPGVESLAHEIMDQARTTRPVITGDASFLSRPAPAPSPSYLTYLGQKESHFTDLKNSSVTLQNERDATGAWLKITARRR